MDMAKKWLETVVKWWFMSSKFWDSLSRQYLLISTITDDSKKLFLRHFTLSVTANFFLDCYEICLQSHCYLWSALIMPKLYLFAARLQNLLEKHFLYLNYLFKVCSLNHRELKLDGAIGHFPEPLWRLKTGHFTT